MEGIEIIKYSSILQDALKYIFKKNTSNNMPYHNFNHLLTVLKYCDYIANGEGVYYDQRLPLHLAAMFHDFDHLGGAQNNDRENIERAVAGFKDFVDFTKEDMNLDLYNQVISIIEASEYPYHKAHTAIGRLEQIIRDADLMQQFEYNWISQTTLGLALEIGITVEEFIPKQRVFLEEIKFLTKTARNFKKRNWTKIMNEFRILEVSLGIE